MAGACTELSKGEGTSLRRTPSRAAIAGLFVLLAGGVAGCAKRSEGEALQAACEPIGVPRMENAEAERLAGEYEITLEATDGPAAGRSSRGRLSLWPNPPDLQGLASAGGGVRSDASAPLYGATDVDVEAVGALRLGDPSSEDTGAPGVLLVERGDQIVLRVGSEANRRDVLRFDGGYLALWVERVTEKGFAGSWTSGVMGVQARGRFCAVRVGE